MKVYIAVDFEGGAEDVVVEGEKAGHRTRAGRPGGLFSLI